MPRAFWKGYLKLSLVSCPVVLYPAVSKTERPKFHRIHRQSGQRLRQQMVEPETQEPVREEDIARGYEMPRNSAPLSVPREAIRAGVPDHATRRDFPATRDHTPSRDYIAVKDEELEKIEIVNTHAIDIEHFVPRAEIDDRYVNAAYYVVPSGEVGQEAYAVIRDAMNARQVAALARIVLTRREHPVMVEPFGKGLLAVTLRYPYEVRRNRLFPRYQDLRLPKEMEDLALHIVDRMKGRFDPSKIEDRYKKALDALLSSKTSARVVEAVGDAPARGRAVDLMQALRASVAADNKPAKKRC